MKFRFGAFAAVGALGFVLQLASIAALLSAGWSYLAATAAGVELAVLHNFWWHERWTWRDRAPQGAGIRRRSMRLLRYHMTTAITSIGGNLVLTFVFVETVRMPPVLANAAAVAVMSLANFRVADRWVFAGRTALTVAAVVSSVPAAAAAELRPETAAAWNRYVADYEAKRDPRRAVPVSAADPQGETIAVPGGAIHRWRASTLIPGITVPELVHALMHPGTPPPQEDVVEARVLGRQNNSLRVYLKLVRTTLITVTYDTEHEMAFDQPTPALATSRSVATSIREADGGDRGFLWKLNSYWRYAQTPAGVIVELESLSLSRSVPALIRPMAGPIISRIARESVARTLAAMKRHYSRSA
jgi:putative flippase GtrA